MRVRQIGLIGVLAAFAMTACTSTPAPLPGSAPQTAPTADVENASEDPPRVAQIFAPTFPQVSRLPRRLDAGDRTVSTRLRCPNGNRRIIYVGFMGGMKLRELALFVTDKPSGSTAVVIMQSKKDALILHLNERGKLIGRSPAYRNQGSWFPNGITHCAKKKGPGIG